MTATVKKQGKCMLADKLFPDPLWAEYKRRELLAEYQRRMAPLWAEYKRRELLAEYQGQKARLWAEYERQEARLWAEYQRQKARIIGYGL